jgi:hypothetical protein
MGIGRPVPEMALRIENAFGTGIGGSWVVIRQVSPHQDLQASAFKAETAVRLPLSKSGMS